MTEQADPLQELLAADPKELSYERARDGLAMIVARLEEGSASLEESLSLWERGEALAKRCGEWLDAAQARLEAASESEAEPEGRDLPL